MSLKLRATTLLLTLFIGIFSLLGFGSSPAYALSCPGISGVGVTLPLYEDGMTHQITVDISELEKFGYSYYVKVKNTKVGDDEAQSGSFPLSQNEKFEYSDMDVEINGDIMTITIKDKEALVSAPTDLGWQDSHVVQLYRNQDWSNFLCSIGEYYTIEVEVGNTCNVTITQKRPDGNGNPQTCYYGWDQSCIDFDTEISVELSDIKVNGELFSGGIVIAETFLGSLRSDPVVNGKVNFTYKPPRAGESSFYISLLTDADPIAGTPYTACTRSINVVENCTQDSCNIEPISVGIGKPAPDPFILCDQLPEGSEAKSKCEQCASGGGGAASGTGDDSRKGVWTAIGCINREPGAIAARFIQLGLSIGGGIALLSILAAAFLYSTSQGDAAKTGQAKELATAALAGLIFMIFSVTILQFIGYSVFQLPGFGG